MAKDQQLLDTAARLFRSHGLEGASIRMIAEEADMLPGSITYRYPTKQALVVALIESGVARAVDRVQRALDGRRDPRERLEHALRAHLDLILQEDDAIFLLLYEWRRLPEDARRKLADDRERYEDIWRGLFEDAADEGLIPEPLSSSLARLYTLGAANWTAQWYSTDGELDSADIADQLLDNMMQTARTSEDSPTATDQED